MKKPAALPSYALTAASLLAAAAVQGQLLFEDNFNTTPASAWNVNVAGNSTADFLFDYSTMGIPAAPNSGGTTIGVRLGANRPGVTGILSGVSISPVGQSFTGDYEVRYDLWANFPGPFPAGGSGSTQLSGGGILSSGTVATYSGAGSGDALWFATLGDGALAADYRIYYRNAHQTAVGLYAAGSQAHDNPYYAGFGGVTAPQDQIDDFATQTGTTLVGSQGMEWHDVQITKIGNTVTWSIDGTLIGTVDISTAGTFGGDNIILAQSDINAGQTTVALDPLHFGLFDNVRVTQVPEPSTYALLGLGALGLIARARRAVKR